MDEIKEVPEKQDVKEEQVQDVEVVEEVVAEEKKAEKKEPKLSPKQKEALEKEMVKLRKIEDAMQMQKEKELSDLELVTLRSGITGRIVSMYSRKAIADVYDYAIDNNKTLIDLVDEVKAKKSPLSAIARNMLSTENEVNRLNYLAIAALVPSGITYNTEEAAQAEVKDELVEVAE